MTNPLQVLPPRGSNTESESDYIISQEAFAQIQRGVYAQPSFFGNHSSTSQFTNFRAGAAASTKYSARETPTLTAAQTNKLEKVAKSMSVLGNLPLQMCRDFLYILINVDSTKDFITISVAIGLEDEMPVSIMGNATAILNVPNLEKATFLANAVAALVKAFEQYIRAPSNAQSSGFDLSSMLDSMLSMFGGTSAMGKALLDTGGIEAKLGNFLSELVLGERIPIPVIAQNPMKEPPSYIGKVFMGELQGLMSHVDITELFPKKIAVFPSPANGAGMSSFKFQNFSSFQGAQPLSDVINKMKFGTTDLPTDSYISDLSATMLQKASTLMGASESATIELNRADNAIPFMIGMSAVNAGTDSSPFSSQTFQQGWTIASSLTSFLAQDQSELINKLRGNE